MTDKEIDRIIKANIKMSGFISLVKRMREAQKEEAVFKSELDRKYRGNDWLMREWEMMRRKELCDKVFDLNSEVDEWLEKIK